MAATRPPPGFGRVGGAGGRLLLPVSRPLRLPDSGAAGAQTLPGNLLRLQVPYAYITSLGLFISLFIVMITGTGQPAPVAEADASAGPASALATRTAPKQQG